MVKVLVITEGGEKNGYGHISRCSALVQAFQNLNPEIEVKFIVSSDTRARKYLKSNDIDYINMNWLKNSNRISALINDETLVIVDSYKAPKKFYKKLNGSYVAVIDDYNRMCYEADAIINVSIENAKEVGYKNRRSVKYIVGNEYVILRKGFCIDSKKRINKTIKNVLITFGGANSYYLIKKVVDLLANEDFKLHIVSPDRNVHKFAKERGHDFYYGLNARGMSLLMSKMDLAISAGGQTINELAYLGVPTIGICLAENQLKNIKRWCRTGFLEYAGESSDKNTLKKLKKLIKTMGDYGVRKKKSKKGRGVVDEKGGQRIVKALLSDYYKKKISLRKVKIEDARDVFNLSNDPLVRKVSRSIKKLKWSNHLSWMENNLSDRDHLFYIVTDSKNFLGQVRFNIDRSAGEALISISIHKKIRGLGLSALIISMAVKELFKTCRDVGRVNAVVREKNVASIKSFKKACFQFVKDFKIDGNPSKLFLCSRDIKC